MILKDENDTQFATPYCVGKFLARHYDVLGLAFDGGFQCIHPPGESITILVLMISRNSLTYMLPRIGQGI